ncbi:Beta-fructofuranosidase, insoluble isoenzyme 1 [Sesamum angolense]|uniref:Beta-fructofuranosidase, insoluble isoenzyme 1 n=1 Tax=Sesamum angolense TaxID=2727404 RepID=A0AAE2BSW7_9LAMI|nr:Beta-fructofuranosidase, insoluble isoenzyme 1 [Sesamum angolense]
MARRVRVVRLRGGANVAEMGGARHLQSVTAFDVKQVHRTGYHFQPPKNWINGPKLCCSSRPSRRIYLREWVKPDNNPMIVADGEVNKTAFRDPTTAWMGKDGDWRITIGGRRFDTGMAFLYKSNDFLHWTKVKHPLHSVNGTGNWECPDFFPVQVNGNDGLDASATGPDVKYVFKVSLDVTRYEYYTIGTYNSEEDKYIPDKGMIDGWNGLRLDYGNFYASKSFFDPSKNRRILWGWANESDTTDNDVEKGWAGIQLIPRTVVLDPNGKQLNLWPVDEVEAQRGKLVELANREMNKGEKIEVIGITAAQADVDVTFTFRSLDKAEPFDPSWDRYDGQKICSQRGQQLKAEDNKHLVLMCSDASRSTLKDGETSMKDGKDAYRPSFAGFVDIDLKDMKIGLRSLIDNSVVESFAEGGKTCITSRVYPTLAIHDKAHLYAFNNGTEPVRIESLSAWTMVKPVNMNG